MTYRLFFVVITLMRKNPREKFVKPKLLYRFLLHFTDKVSVLFTHFWLV